MFGQGLAEPAAEAVGVMLQNKIQAIELRVENSPSLCPAEDPEKLLLRTRLRVEVASQNQVSPGIVTQFGLEGLTLHGNRELEENALVEVRPLDFAELAEKAVVGRVFSVERTGYPGRFSYNVRLLFVEKLGTSEDSWASYMAKRLGFDPRTTFRRLTHERAKTTIPARLFEVQTTEREPLQGEVLDLGVSGALLKTDVVLNTGDELECEVCLWRVLPALRLRCRIVDVQVDSDNSSRHYCLVFLALDREKMKLLGNYVIFLVNQTR